MAVERFKPAAPRRLLIALGGLAWCIVGVALLLTAWGWLRTASREVAAPAVVVGLVAAGIVGPFGFTPIARKNLARLDRLADPSCVFAFQAWRSYLLIAVMIVLGMTLRHSGLPRPLLAAVYATMGGALLIGSFAYLERWRRGA